MLKVEQVVNLMVSGENFKQPHNNRSAHGVRIPLSSPRKRGSDKPEHNTSKDSRLRGNDTKAAAPGNYALLARALAR